MIGDKEEIQNLLNYFFEPEENYDVNKIQDNFCLEYDEIKLAIIVSLEEFLRQYSSKELKFPASFSNDENNLVKRAALKLGLKYQYIQVNKYQNLSVVYKTDQSNLFNEPISLNFTWNCQRTLNQFLTTNPITIKERQDLQNKNDKIDIRNDRNRTTTGKLMAAVPLIPQMKVSLDDLSDNIQSSSSSTNITSGSIQATQCSTSSVSTASTPINSTPGSKAAFIPGSPISDYKQPVSELKADIIDAIINNPVTLIFGAAGSGKTTGIAQMIMQDCASKSQACRMICTEPYGLSAHSNAQIVTQNWQENIGQTVGFQIRLESKVSPRTLLTFCTSEVLLRTLYGDRGFLNCTTHIIIDEVQDRHQHTDLLMTVLKQIHHIYQHLKIIILLTTPITKLDLCYWFPNGNYSRNSYFRQQFDCSPQPTNNSSSNSTNIQSSSSIQNNNSTLNLSNSSLNPAQIMQQRFTELVRHISQYFDCCPVIYVRKPAKDIDEIFLEDILQMLNFNLESAIHKDGGLPLIRENCTAEKWLCYWLVKSPPMGTHAPNLAVFKSLCNSFQYQLAINHAEFMQMSNSTNNSLSTGIQQRFDSISQLKSLLTSIGKSTGGSISGNNTQFNKIDFLSIYEDIIWMIFSRTDVEDISLDYDINDNLFGSQPDNIYDSNQNYMKLLFNLIVHDFVSINHQHRLSGITALMTCSWRGFTNAVRKLLNLGADPFLFFSVSLGFNQIYLAYIHQMHSQNFLMGNIYKLLYKRLKSYSLENMMKIFPNHYKKQLYVLYASDLAIIAQVYEIADMIFAKIVSIQENLNFSSISSHDGQINIPSASSTLTTSASTVEFTRDDSSTDLNPYEKELCNVLFNNCEFLLNIIMQLLTLLTTNTEAGTILIFLPDYDSLCLCKSVIQQNAEIIFPKAFKYQIYLLHSKMLIQDLNSLFNSNTKSIRKIILATNIAESCININDVSFVIDCGLEMKKTIDNDFNMVSRKLSYISKVQTALRVSRANNPTNRICFHLYSQLLYNSLGDYKSPSILTRPINEIVLQVKLLTQFGAGLDKFLNGMMDKPSSPAIDSSLILLKGIEALDLSEEITELGYHLYDLPIDPKYGKMVLFSILLKCLDPILTISCILSYQDPFVQNCHGKKFTEIMETKQRFASNTYSDHMVLLRAFQFWQKARAENWENSFCQKNYLSSSIFETITGIRTQLLGQLRASGFVKARGNGDIRDLNVNSENWAVVKAAIISGTVDGLAVFNRSQLCLTNKSNNLINIHPSSILSRSNFIASIGQSCESTDLFIYDNVVKVPLLSSINSSQYNCQSINNQLSYIKCVTMVTPITVALMTSHIRFHGNSLSNSAAQMTKSTEKECTENETTNVPPVTSQISELVFKAEDDIQQMILHLRQKWQCFVLRKLKNPSRQHSNQDEAILRTIVAVLSLEEQAYGLKQPSGVGARPRPMAPEYCNQSECPVNNTIGVVDHLPQHQLHGVMPAVPPNIFGIAGPANTQAIEVDKDKSIDSEKLTKIEQNNVVKEDKQKTTNGIQHFFLIKLHNKHDMIVIAESKSYTVNMQLRNQINNLLNNHYIIFLIFTNGSNNTVLGYGRVQEIVSFIHTDLVGTKSLLSNSHSNEPEYFSLKLEVYLIKPDVQNKSQLPIISDIDPKIFNYIQMAAKTSTETTLAQMENNVQQPLQHQQILPNSSISSDQFCDYSSNNNSLEDSFKITRSISNESVQIPSGSHSNIAAENSQNILLKSCHALVPSQPPLYQQQQQQQHQQPHYHHHHQQQLQQNKAQYAQVNTKNLLMNQHQRFVTLGPFYQIPNIKYSTIEQNKITNSSKDVTNSVPLLNSSKDLDTSKSTPKKL